MMLPFLMPLSYISLFSTSKIKTLESSVYERKTLTPQVPGLDSQYSRKMQLDQEAVRPLGPWATQINSQSNWREVKIFRETKLFFTAALFRERIITTEKLVSG